MLEQNGQIAGMVGEVARNKALAVALGKATVVDTKGNPVDLTGFVSVDDEAAPRTRSSTRLRTSRMPPPTPTQ